MRSGLVLGRFAALAACACLGSCGRARAVAGDAATDAAAPPADADGTADGTAVDAAPPPVPCLDLATSDPWRDRTGAHTLAERGEILACAHAASFTGADVAKSPYFDPSIGPATNGYELFVVQYVSEGRPGIARAVTALFYLPAGGGTNVPIAAVDHATSGMGPACGPTHLSVLTDNLAVPLAGRGYAVVAPDYAGMGVDNGMTSYLVGQAEAAATLDAVRALRRFHEARFDAARLGTDFFVLGHSQGGHAALFTHQGFDPSIGVSLLGSVSFAPGWGDMRAVAKSFSSASGPDDAMTSFALMSLYAQMLYRGGPDASTWLTPPAATALPGWLHDQCLPTLFTTIETRFGTQGDLYQPDFMLAARACAFTAPCPGFEPWSSALIAEQPGDFASTAPALILQGGADTLVTPAATACIAKRLAARGTRVEACVYASDSHGSIVPSALPQAIQWMSGRRTGVTPSVCPAPLPETCPP